MKSLILLIYTAGNLLLVSFCGNAQTFSWAQGFPSIASTIFTGKSDAIGNIYSIGWFNGTVDVDRGPNVHNLTAIGSGNMFLLKEDAGGNFIWAKHFAGMSSGSNGLWGRALDFDGSGNIYIGGAIRDSFDMNPGAGVYHFSTGGAQVAFILKLDSSGNFIWAKKHKVPFPVNNTSGIGGLKIDGDVMYVSSGFAGTVDIDPGPGTFNVTSTLGVGGDMLLISMDTAGNFIWGKQIGGTGIDNVTGLAIDSFSNLYITGGFQNTVDFDPGPAVNSLTSAGNYDVFVAKYDSTGSYLWAKGVGSGSEDFASGLSLDPLGNVLITGHFGSTVDFDPGPGVFNITSNSGRSAFTLKLENNGGFKWAKQTGATVGLFGGNSIATDSLGYVYTALVLPNSCDIDPGTGVYTVPAGVAVQKLDSSGNFIWGAGWQGDFSWWIGLDGNNSVYTTGTFSGPNNDFDPGLDTYFLSGSSQGSGFIHKMCQGIPPVVPISASDTVGCIGDTVMLTAATLPGTYHWSRNNVTLPDTTSSIKITVTGTYAVRVTGSCPSIGAHQIFFYSKANPVISLPLGTISANIGQQVSVTASVVNPGSGSTINWYKNGVLFNTTTTTNASYTKAAGTDTIVAVVFGPGNPCYTPDTSNELIIDAINNVETLYQLGISVFPNPSTGVISMAATSPIDHIQISDLTGKEVYACNPRAFQLTIDLSNEAAGVYFYTVTSGKSTVRGKLVVH